MEAVASTPVLDRQFVLQKAVVQQFLEEHGPEETPEHKTKHRNFNGNRTFDTGCTGCRETQRTQQLRQKYGLMASQLTDGERQIVRRENQETRERAA